MAGFRYGSATVGYGDTLLDGCTTFLDGDLVQWTCGDAPTEAHTVLSVVRESQTSWHVTLADGRTVFIARKGCGCRS